MVLNEMAEGTSVEFVVKETHGCMIETVYGERYENDFRWIFVYCQPD